MDNKVEISRGTLAALVGSLAMALLALAFLFGRLSAQPVAPIAAATPTASLLPPLAQAPPAVLESPTPASLTAVTPTPTPRSTPSPVAEKPPPRPVAVVPPPRVGPPPPEPPVARPPAHHPTRRRPKPAPTSKPTSQGGVAARPPAQAAPPPAKSADVEGLRHYFAQLDGAMAGTTALSDPNGFATELLQQSLQGDNSGFDALLSSAEEAVRKVQGIKPPPSCAEHHKLTLGQLRDGVELLRKVKGATTSMDTASLSALSTEGKGLQADAAHLQELDRQLRAQLH